MGLVMAEEALQADVLANAMLNDIKSWTHPPQNHLANADGQLNPAPQVALQGISDNLKALKDDVQVVKTNVQATTNNLQVVKTDVQELKSTSNLLRAQMSHISIRLHNKEVWLANPQGAPNLRPLKKYIPDAAA
eukprot:jgi/Ulvmu1/8312/UM042_0018.1